MHTKMARNKGVMSVKRFFCFGKQGFCDNFKKGVDCDFYECENCEYADGSGGEYREVELCTVTGILEEDYDLDRLKELIEADRDGRCVVYQPGYVVASEYYKDGDFCVRETAGVISKKEYMDAVKGDLESIESETHGEWLQYHDSLFHYCSNCLEDAMINRNTRAEELTSHCPNCGRKMKIHR